MADTSTQKPGLLKRLLGEKPPATPSAREEKERVVRNAARMLTDDPVNVLGYYEKFANSRTLQDLYRHHALLNSENAGAAFKAIAHYLDQNPDENVYGSFPVGLMSQLGKRYPELADAYRDTQLMDGPTATQPGGAPRDVVIAPPPDNLNQRSDILTRVDTRGSVSRTLKPATQFAIREEAALYPEASLPSQTETTIGATAPVVPTVAKAVSQPIAVPKAWPLPRPGARSYAHMKEEGLYSSVETDAGGPSTKRERRPVMPWQMGNASSERISLTDRILSKDALSGPDETHGPAGASR